MHRERERIESSGKRVMIVTGEASGDLHGAALVRSMLRIDPSLRFYGIGGENLGAAGIDIVARSSDMAVVGLTEVLSKLGYILKVRRRLKQLLQAGTTDLVILVDYPDFNMPLAKVAKRLGVKVFYYISPQVWAWRRGRIHQLARYVDRMAVIFPFETSVYEKVPLDVRFVGHPLLDAVGRKYSRHEALKQFGLADGETTVGILPGSRESEVVRILPAMVETAKILKKRLPAVQFVLPLADTLEYDFVSHIIRQHDADVTIVRNSVYDVVGISDIAMVASGTATLETALLETPMIVVYKVSPFSYLMGKMIVHVDNIGMVNIIAGKTVVPEFIQGEANASHMADALYEILTDSSRMDAMKEELTKIREKLGQPGAAGRAANLAYGLLGETSGVRRQKSEYV